MRNHDHRRVQRFNVIAGITLAAGLLSACASSAPGASSMVQPFAAIQAAAADPSRGLPGTFVLQVQNVSRLDAGVYLNSEDDYRDQRNLSIVVRRDALAGLEATYGAPLEKSLWGKRLLVNGVAKRVRIDFTVDGAPSGKYYYQTHVEVRDASQVRVQPVG